MTYEGALEKIKANWAEYEHGVIEGHEAVWIAKSDQSAFYETQEEWIGMKGDGTLVWAYASGCSCWDGNYETLPVKDIKVLSFKHDHTPEEWQQKIIAFAEAGIKAKTEEL